MPEPRPRRPQHTAGPRSRAQVAHQPEAAPAPEFVPDLDDHESRDPGGALAIGVLAVVIVLLALLAIAIALSL